MAVNFNSNSVFNLKPINVEEVRKEVDGLLIGGEQIEFAFQTFRDQLIFTNKRIISVDVQGITGKKEIICNHAVFQNSVFFNSNTGFFGNDSGFGVIYYVYQWIYS